LNIERRTSKLVEVGLDFDNRSSMFEIQLTG
jgi:hypothetical protein